MENWLKLVEYEYLNKKTPYQITRLKERFEEFKQQGNLDESLSPEKMAEIILDFVKKEDERKEAEREKEGEKRERRYMKLMQKRINDVKSNPKPEKPPKTLEYQLGCMIGDQIVDRYLLTLSNERGTRNVIEIAPEEQAEYDRLHNLWGDAYNIDKENSKKEWQAYRDYAHFLQKKYLPAKLECYVGRIESVNDIEELKQGIRHALWNSDVCCYNTDVIDLNHDEDMWFSKVTIYLEKPEV